VVITLYPDHIPSYLAQRVTATAVHYDERALASALSSAVAQITANVTERIIYDKKDINWYDGVSSPLGSGFMTGLLIAVASDYWTAKGQPKADVLWSTAKSNPGFFQMQRTPQCRRGQRWSRDGRFQQAAAVAQTSAPNHVMQIPYGNPFKG
jgi:hypothetical protein